MQNITDWFYIRKLARDHYIIALVSSSSASPTKSPTASMPVGLEAWFTQIPPVTRTWLALAVLTSVAVVRDALVRAPLTTSEWLTTVPSSAAMPVSDALATLF